MALNVSFKALRNCHKIYTSTSRCLITTPGTSHSKPNPGIPLIDSTQLYDVKKETTKVIQPYNSWQTVPRNFQSLSSPFIITPYNSWQTVPRNFQSLGSPFIITAAEKANIEYKCPTKSKPWVEILDIVNTVGYYDCPNTSKDGIDFVLPTMQFFNIGNVNKECPGMKIPEKLAKVRKRKVYQILKIKDKRMNRHKMKKNAKRLKSMFKKMKVQKKAKKEVRDQAAINAVLSKYDNYDPLQKIQEDIRLARRGGFRIDVFGDNSK